MSKLKNAMASAAVLLAAGALQTAIPLSAHAATTIKIANYFPDDHPLNLALKEKFKPEIESRSNGNMKVQIFSNGTLGGEEKLYNAVRGGTIDMAVLGTIMDSEVDYVGIIQLPFLLKDYAHAQKVLHGDIGKHLVSDFPEKLGIRSLAFGVQGFRVILSNRQINSMDDFKGLRLRFPGIKTMITTGQALGANITPLAITEVFNALDQKVVDGVENPYANILTSKWYESAKYILETNHVFSPNMYLINDKKWASLSADEQAILQQVSIDTAVREWELLVNSESGDKAKLEENGVTITVPDDAFREKLIEAEQGLYSDYYERLPEAREIVTQIRAVD